MPPAVALLNYISCGILWKIFCQTGTFRGVFCTYHWYRRIHPTLWFFAVFFYLLFAGKISEAAMWGAGLPECMPHRRNWFPPPPHPDVSVSPSLDPKGGEPHSLAVEWVGGPNSDDWIEGPELCILYSLASVVELKEKGPLCGRLSWLFFIFEIRRKSSSKASMGEGRAAPCLACQWVQKDVRAAYGRARAAKTH